MRSLLEENLSLTQSEAADKGLKVQNEAYGVWDAPFVNNFLKKQTKIKNILDIGTGEGSFIAPIAEANKEYNSSQLSAKISFASSKTNIKISFLRYTRISLCLIYSNVYAIV